MSARLEAASAVTVAGRNAHELTSAFSDIIPTFVRGVPSPLAI
jgi:hypothetical protein